MLSLEGKVAIITGASRGQGAAEARLFHSAGAALLLTDLNQSGESLAAKLGKRCIFFRQDVADQEGWEELAKVAKSRFGTVDILVNNAGITGYETVDQITRGDMERYLGVHLYGAMFGIQAVAPLMSSRGGSIVNVASTAAVRGYANYVGYGVSKWALRGLGRYAAHDLIGRNIRVNTILPGGVDTPMLTHGEGTSLIAAARAAVPMNRFASAEEIAHIALFLASDASSYMTGAEIIADGGLNA